MKNIILRFTKRALKWFAVTMAVVLFFCICLYLFVALHPDTGPVDDKNLHIDFLESDSRENGYIPLIVAAAGLDDDGHVDKPSTALNSIFYCEPSQKQTSGKNDRDTKQQETKKTIYSWECIRNATNGQIKLLEKEQGEKLNKVRRIVSEYDKFQVPNECKILRTDWRFLWFCGHYMRIRDIARINLIQAWHELKHNNTDGALERLNEAYRIGHIMENMGGDIISVNLGLSTKSLCAIELSTMLDSEFSTPKLIREGLAIIKRYPISSQATVNALKMDYVNNKHFLEHGNDDRFEKGSYINSICEDIIVLGGLGSFGNWVCDKIWLRIAFRPNKTQKAFYDMYVYAINEIKKDRHDFFEYERNKPSSVYECKHEKEYLVVDSLFANLSFWDALPIKLSGNTIGVEAVWMTWPSYRTAPEFLIIKKSESNLILVKTALLAFFMKNGKPPANLGLLVPEFLDSIPEDPFSGEPLKYSPEKNFVYSVGWNLKDDLGKSKRDINHFESFREAKNEKDLTIHILPIAKK